jgi:hypothetical protein
VALHETRLVRCSSSCGSRRRAFISEAPRRARFSLTARPLLTPAQKEFDVLLTIDGSLEFQQNLSRLQIGVIEVHVPKNQLIHYQVIQNELLAAIEKVRPGEAIHVKVPSA